MFDVTVFMGDVKTIFHCGTKDNIPPWDQRQYSTVESKIIFHRGTKDNIPPWDQTIFHRSIKDNIPPWDQIKSQ